jgi:hypothetical protein
MVKIKGEVKMKKLVLVLLAVVLMGSVSYGAQDINEIIDDNLNTGNAVVEADMNIEGSRTVTFFATINNNRTTASVTAKVTAAVSLNGTDWQDISWMDTAGGVTPQTTETTASAKQTYVGWMDNRLSAKYIRLRINADELTATPSHYVAADNADINVSVVQEK